MTSKHKRTDLQARSRTRDVRGHEPVDRLTRRVTAPAIEPPVEPPLKGSESETPLPTIPWRGRGCRREDDLTGRKIGLLVVIGYAGDASRSVPIDVWNAGDRKPVPRSSKRARWVAKCDCGVYIYMRTRTIKRLSHGACSRCRAKGLGT